MIPYISWWKRIIAWLIWHFEGYESTDDAFFYILDHPNYTRIASLMRDYWYVRNSRERMDERLTDADIVRCRDCKHYVDASVYVDKELHDCTYWGDWTTSNGFCAWGERRDA